MTDVLIHKKMAAILADNDAIAKSKRNAAQGFQFRGIDDVMNELHNTFAKHGVYLTTECLEVIREQRETKNGGCMTHQFQKLKFTFHAEDGSCTSSIVWGEAMDSGDKSGNKCMSIGLKYALLQAFLIPTEDMLDPDSESPQQAREQRNDLNLEEPYSSQRHQKQYLKGIFQKLGIKDEHVLFMREIDQLIQGMPMKNISGFVKPKAEEFLKKGQ